MKLDVMGRYSTSQLLPQTAINKESERMAFRIFWAILPVVISGTLNMIFVKLSVLKGIQTPMDGGLILKDGNRLFGDNKTWKGFLGMPIFTGLSYWGLEGLAYCSPMVAAQSPFDFEAMPFPVPGFIMGFFIGFTYVLFELPNSFIKRRINIPPGKNVTGFKGKIFLVVDQCDSSLGMTLMLPFFITTTLLELVLIFTIGSLIHYLMVILLYMEGLKKQAG